MNSPFRGAAMSTASSCGQAEEQVKRLPKAPLRQTPLPLPRTKVGMVSLGCAKNLVDAEIMLGSVLQRGMEITSRAEDADVLVVNTCAFIDSANVDADLAFADRRPTYIPDYDTPRFRLTPAHSAYVKIAEGCNHPCSFCVIPQMRGKHRSRTPQSVLAEIRRLISEGVREINLISQDTTYYGMDLWTAKAGPRQPVDSTRGPTLAALLREIQEIDGEFWVRLLYTHPAHWSDELIDTIAQCDKVARYVDIPLQHIHEAMLQRMRRETSRQHIENLIYKLRSGIPGVTMRTTFIVGFPGETEEQFASLLDFIQRTRFERLGIFKYSQEEGSRAAKMPGHVPVKTKNARYRMAMSIQREIAHETEREKIGRELKLLVDQPHVARSEADAPDVDAHVILSKEAPVGDFVWRPIVGSRGYDLLA